MNTQTWPGPMLEPDGAVPTVRLEMIREGLQECEARIYVEKALLDEGLKAKLGEALAVKCREALDERIRAVVLGSRGEHVGYMWYLATGTLARSRALYEMAARVRKALEESGENTSEAGRKPSRGRASSTHM